MIYTFYWYPKCTTCQKAKKWLDAREIKLDAIDLKATPPTAAQFLAWFDQKDFPVKKFFNTSGLVYREMGLKDKLSRLTATQAAQLLASNGMLIKRPLLVKPDGRLVAIGFKEAAYEALTA